jgi:hypothetical protein
LPDLRQDALADRYRLERELSRGGMATVFLARDLRHARAGGGTLPGNRFSVLEAGRRGYPAVSSREIPPP